MIVVIADDFTGAAELAGIGMKFGLNIEVLTTSELNTEADINIIDMNTRSKSSMEAIKSIERVLQDIDRYEYEFIFKKIDSVFRGHVYDEISVLLKKFQKKSVLLAPANPSRGRTIKDGIYFIDGLHLNETVFSGDPESPTYNSDILSLLGVGVDDGVSILKSGDEIPVSRGKIYVGEANLRDDMISWAKKLDNNIIPVGAADFFEGILSFLRYPGNVTQDQDYNSLFICGSSLSRVVNLEEELFSKNPKVVKVTDEYICMDDFTGSVEKIAQLVIDQFQITNNVILFVNTSKSQEQLPTKNIPEYLAAVASFVLKKIEVRELIVEGGTTSSEVVRKIGWDRFKPVNQICQEIVKLQVIDSPGHFLMVKPGSYKWPANFWSENLINLKQNH